ncbi:RHS repeat-associated core domain-containing protein [Burkholderia sp. S-53]|uniref:RHS repeat-associated core domain-containing protein n=1 Tax=Burkholderia sp. S-53 TaxID=2906514 RepID=UPI0021D12343|nr:RHS repeat-associated core domain-containing protein [Burkholderia sp. S-53]UXU86128.1 hypothetical protein LXM88_02295 [Burkholderia sp. S-53]
MTRGNRQRQHYNVAGQLAGSDLQLAGQSTWQPLLRAISYSAAGQVLREEAGNGVVTDYTYEPQTQRLAELHTTRPPQAGRTTLLQALSYQYDPVGNLLAIDDAAKATRHTRNQRVAPASHYSYDALYQLTRATGRENANAGRQSQALPPPIVPLFQEIGELTPYTRTYRYDRGANLTTLQHQGTRSSYTQQMVVARTSNRAVPQTDGLTPGDVASYFDACGNLKALGASQPLAWDSRNQLQRTTQVVRRGLDDDTEVYWYDGAGQRATKLGTARTSGTTRTERVRYLPGLELRQIEQTRTGETLPTPVERLQVLTLGAAGRQSVRLLHWELGQPSTIENDQLRVSLDDQIGSSMLELDAQADLLTWEEYYPYGGTAVWSARSDTEAKYKYVRYSGQERDATGLYYYGFRYYAPWLARWLNPDPAGPVDGLNLFCMVGNNPVSNQDVGGLVLLTRHVSGNMPVDVRARLHASVPHAPHIPAPSSGAMPRAGNMALDIQSSALQGEHLLNDPSPSGNYAVTIANPLVNQPSTTGSPSPADQRSPFANSSAEQQSDTNRKILKWSSISTVSSASEQVSENAGNSKIIEVKMGEFVVEKMGAILMTDALWDCSALAVLSALVGEIYTKRTLIHLRGSSLEFGLTDEDRMPRLLLKLKKQLEGGGVVIWVGGINSQSDTGLEAAIGQNYGSNDQPILNLMKNEGVSVVIAGSSGISIYPNGTFTLREGVGRGILSKDEKKQLFEELGVV